MNTINRLSSTDSITLGDLMALWSTNNGGTRKVSMSVLVDFIKSQGGESGLTVINTFDDLRDLDPSDPNTLGQYLLLGGDSVDDGKGGIYYFDALSTSADDNFTIVDPNAAGAGRWLRLNTSSFTIVNTLADLNSLTTVGTSMIDVVFVKENGYFYEFSGSSWNIITKYVQYVETTAELTTALGGLCSVVTVKSDGSTFVYNNSLSAVDNTLTIINGWVLKGTLTLDTVGEIVDLTSNDEGRSIYVKELNRGGNFIYDSSEVVNHNGGTNFYGSIRQYEGSVFVEWFGVVSDAVTDNTAVYNTMIDALPEGSTIEWKPLKTYKGAFVSNKAFVLKGNGATLTAPTGQNFMLAFEGTIDEVGFDLTVAPSYGDTSLSEFNGITEDTLVELWSGTQRTTGGDVNYEIVKVRNDGTVYDMIYSEQDYKTYQPATGQARFYKITPLIGIDVSGFRFEAGANAHNGVYVQYAEEVKVSDIYMNEGTAATVYLSRCYGYEISNIKRIKPSATGSGQGYNVNIWACKYGKSSNIYGEITRHEYDQDSTYVSIVENVRSINCVGGSVVELAHNGFTGHTIAKDINISGTGHGVHISNDTTDSALLGRNIVVENVTTSNDRVLNANITYNAVYMSYATHGLKIDNIVVKNTSGTTFDWVGATYNNSYSLVKVADPQGNTVIDNVSSEAATWGVQIEAVTDSSANIDIRNINVDRYRNLVMMNDTNGIGACTITNLMFEDTAGVHGEALINFLDGVSSIQKLMVYGLKTLPSNALAIKYANNVVPVPTYSYIDTSGFVGNLADVTGVAGGTISQYDILRFGETAGWSVAAATTLDATEPFARPITSGNTFKLLNRSGTYGLTIPAGSETVTSGRTLNPLEQYEYRANGAKWRLQRKYTGVTLS